jgi:hypothetical protein
METHTQEVGAASPKDPTLEAVMRFAPPGHFYSPHPSLLDLEAGGYSAAVDSSEVTVGIELNLAAQLTFFTEAARAAPRGPWHAEHRAGLRHYYSNDFFRFGDSNSVYHMASKFRPARIIEIGSGFSTACWLDSIDALGLRTSIACIEPHPNRLFQLCSTDDLSSRIKLHKQPLQAMPGEMFEQLERNDILFIDSTHVSKCNSDVNCLFFSILPRLKPGVVVHFHDIFWPFEYPLGWYREGRTWNEAYLLRAFLQFNAAFEILRFNSCLAQKFPDELAEYDPRYVSDGGGSIWLLRV